MLLALQNLSTRSFLQLGKRHFSPHNNKGEQTKGTRTVNTLTSFVFLPQAYLEHLWPPPFSFCKPIKAWRNANSTFGWNNGSCKIASSSSSSSRFKVLLLIIRVSGIYDLWRSGAGVEDDNNKALWSPWQPVLQHHFLVSQIFCWEKNCQLKGEGHKQLHFSEMGKMLTWLFFFSNNPF